MVTPGVVISVVPVCDLDDKLENSWCTVAVVCTSCDVIYGVIVVIWFVKVMVDSPIVTAVLSSRININKYY